MKHEKDQNPSPMASLKNLCSALSPLLRPRTHVSAVLFLSLSFFFLFSAYHSPAATAATFASRLLSASSSLASKSHLVSDPTLSSVTAVERTDGNPNKTVPNAIRDLTSCDIFDGKWVADDDSDPPYRPGSCPYVDGPFNCFRNGRPDSDYLRYRWKPHGCQIPRFDGKRMLEMLRGKRVVFVGDSLNRNMWESLVCALRESLNDMNRVFEASARREFRTQGFYSFTFRDYKCSIDFVKSPFLVQEWKLSDRRETLRLDMIQGSFSNYNDADIIIFNTGHWWTHQKTYKGKGFFQEGDHVYRTLQVTDAYRKALRTWSQWVDANIDSNRTRVFFAGYSASHFKGGQWNSGGSCDGETGPITNQSYLAAYPWMMKTLESVIAEMKTPVFYLNITKMTDYRKDGHPSIYRQEEAKRSSGMYQDCSHWCLPGVPDSWNELLYATLLISHHH